MKIGASHSVQRPRCASTRHSSTARARANDSARLPNSAMAAMASLIATRGPFGEPVASGHPCVLGSCAMTVVTRFAPSPTGFLHIGGARTALFNWLFARHHGGKYLLRIEDTDRQRSTEAAIDAIIDGLQWLGLDPDEPPIFQSARAERHAEVARDLLAKGNAYYCYATPEELEEMRAKAKAEGRPMRYDGRWRDRDPTEAPALPKPRSEERRGG